MTAIEASSVGVRTMADGTLRLTVDIEPRHAKDAFSLFGAPGVPMALAALKTAAQASNERDHPKGGPLARLAGQWCRDPQFIEFIRPIYDRMMGGNGNGWGDVTPDDDFAGSNEQWARHCILVICNINERKMLDHDDEAAAKFHKKIRVPFVERREEVKA